MGEARLSVTHGGRRVAFHGAEVTLSVDQYLAHGPGLCHMDEGRVDHLLAVRVIVTAGIAANLGAFVMLMARIEIELVHGVENTPLGGLQTIPDIGQGSRNNDRHGVIQK